MMPRWTDLSDYLMGAPNEQDNHVPIVKLGARVVATIFIFMALDWWITRLGRLTESDYTSGSIALATLRNLGTIKNALPMVALLLLAIRFPPRLRWREIEHGRYVRVLVLLCTALLAWVYSTYAPNHYFGRDHGSDRILLIVLASLVAWRPAMSLPFLVLAVPILFQFYLPIGGYAVGIPTLLTRILVLFCASLILQSITGRRSSTEFVLCTLALVASNYWACGVGKVLIGWHSFGHIYLIAPAAHVNGWLGFLEPSTFDSVVHAAAKFDWPMRYLTLLLECGACLFLLHRRVAIGLLIGWILFHVGVFALSGILFWQWMLLDAALLLFLIFMRGERARSLPVFGGRRFALSLVLIVGSSIWFKPIPLAWFDAAISYNYRLEATMESGERAPLSAAFFAPYDYQFTFTGFAYLVETPTLGIVAGATSDRATAEALIATNSPNEVFEVESTLGSIRFDAKRAAAFDSFIRTFVGNLESRGSKLSWLHWLRAPPVLWSTEPPRAYRFGQGRIEHVKVVQVTSYWDGNRYAEIRQRTVREIALPKTTAQMRGSPD